MYSIKLVLADLDGTVVQPTAQAASDEVIAAVHEAVESGVEFAAITGRPYSKAKDLLRRVGFNAPSVFEGGAIIIDPTTDKVLWSKTVTVENSRRAVEMLCRSASVIDYGAGMIGANDIELANITEPTLSIWGSVPAEKADGIVNELRALPGMAVHANAGPGGDFTRTGVQVTHVEADKEHAVRELLGLAGSDKQHTMAIGDGDNDLPLFKSANIKVAMGNASDALKTAADEVVNSVDEDGFAEALRKFISK